ncbi:MAG: hypothetical protein L0Z70_11940 [Chloroflexi bacterium]|nr:hypothetical protein [Chloroflexota bacterium]
MIIEALRTLNQLLTAGIAITAFSLLLYALTFNLRDRVARSFALILACVVIVFVSDAIASVMLDAHDLETWLRLQWVGIVFLPSAYLHFSDALLATTGRPSRGRRRLAVRLTYAFSLAFLAALPAGLLVGSLVQDEPPAPHLERTWLTWVFTSYYALIIAIAWVNLLRAYRRTVAPTSRRRVSYLLLGALAPALGSYPYLLFGSGLAARSALLFWSAATLSNLMVSALLVLMAYATAFFGVPWPDRIVKRRLFKWFMRGPVTASTVLAATTLARRWGEGRGELYTAFAPVLMVVLLLVMEYMITLAAPVWERWLFHGGDREDIELLQRLEERLLTANDLRQFLDAVLAAACDRLQARRAFVAALGPGGLEMLVTIGRRKALEEEQLSDGLLELTRRNGGGTLFAWGEYWLAPLYSTQEDEAQLLGLMAVARQPKQLIDAEQGEALSILARRAALALEDRRAQQVVFTSLEALTPEVELIQTLRAAARYGGGVNLTEALTRPAETVEDHFSGWVKDALTHYWGGPKLTESPLLKLRIVQQALEAHEGNPTNALRAILREAIEQVRPEGERRFTGEWILYNILELKFMEGRKVREVALRLAMSEADLYRKQRVAIEAVANAILDMETKAAEEDRRGFTSA